MGGAGCAWLSFNPFVTLGELVSSLCSSSVVSSFLSVPGDPQNFWNGWVGLAISSVCNWGLLV